MLTFRMPALADFFEADSYVAYRWKTYHDAIAAAWPNLKLIATTRPETTLDPKEEYCQSRISLSKPSGIFVLTRLLVRCVPSS